MVNQTHVRSYLFIDPPCLPIRVCTSQNIDNRAYSGHRVGHDNPVRSDCRNDKANHGNCVSGKDLNLSNKGFQIIKNSNKRRLKMEEKMDERRVGITG
jgi:hypothetical protein